MKEYYLCSSAVIEHFPDLDKSKPFKSGYANDSDVLYYVVKLNNYYGIDKYYRTVIAPYNEKSNVKIDFWLRQCVESQVDVTHLTKKDCKALGIFRAIENAIGLTKETNVAFAIYAMSKKFGQTPIEFVNSIT